jgi:hypothetical protein
MAERGQNAATRRKLPFVVIGGLAGAIAEFSEFAHLSIAMSATIPLKNPEFGYFEAKTQLIDSRR